ncbi:MAG: hypothetical protein GY859_34440 [Desulfobacterales bacterium]|nr:hypothetical protein [Desulfobacterales bacterium]
MTLKSSTFAFTRELRDFSYTLSSLDHVWNILFPDQEKKWRYLHVNKYMQTFYITCIDGDGGLEVEPKKGVRAMDSMGASFYAIEEHDHLAQTWRPLIASARKWLKVVRKDWIKANKSVQAEYPLRYRYGVAPNALIRASLTDIYRLDKELGKGRTLKLVRLIEDGFFNKSKNTEVSTMTAEDYFHYCRIAYIAARRKKEKVDESLSGREMYERYADGRHEGLLDIDPTSAEEFADWIDGKHPKKQRGGHPWEIKRGGNTTHIDLSVSRPSYYRKEGFKVELRGESIGRMVETMGMFLAIHDAGLPISIANPEGVRKRLLAQDNIGIIPSYSYLHRANQHFGREEDVFDVMHYDELGRFKRRITPFITWEPLPILKPKDA